MLTLRLALLQRLMPVAGLVCAIPVHHTRLRAAATGFLHWDRRFEETFHTIGRYLTAVNVTDSAWGNEPVA